MPKFREGMAELDRVLNTAGCAAILHYLQGAQSEEALRLADVRSALHVAPGSMHHQIAKLESAGLIRVTGEPNAPKRIQLTMAGGRKFVGIPMLGTIRAGMPTAHQGESAEYIKSWDDVLPLGDGYFALEARGESMTGAGIFSGDRVIFRRCELLSEVRPGQIAAVQIPDSYGDYETTVKRVHVEDRGATVRLCAANSEFSDIVVPAETVHIAGVFHASIHFDNPRDRR